MVIKSNSTQSLVHTTILASFIARNQWQKKVEKDER
jgi:hypothetical protein